MTNFMEAANYDVPPLQDICELSKNLCISRDDVISLVAAGRLPEPTIRSDGSHFWRWGNICAALPKAKCGLIYFLKCGDFIKIGFSQSIDRRIKSLGAGTPYETHLLHTMRGTMLLEGMLHERFKSLRHKYEWFRAEPELIDFIESLK